jgi:hypothetical protein
MNIYPCAQYPTRDVLEADVISYATALAMDGAPPAAPSDIVHDIVKNNRSWNWVDQEGTAAICMDSEGRKKPTTAELRRSRYVAETDPLFMKAFELVEGAEDVELDGGKAVRVPASEKMAAWEAAKNQIRAELPYP